MPSHRLRDGDVLREIEVVRVALASSLGHRRIAVVRQARDDGVGLVDGEVILERLGVARVECHGAQIRRSVCLDHGFRRRGVDVTERDVIITRFGQQTRDERRRSCRHPGSKLCA